MRDSRGPFSVRDGLELPWAEAAWANAVEMGSKDGAVGDPLEQLSPATRAVVQQRAQQASPAPGQAAASVPFPRRAKSFADMTPEQLAEYVNRGGRLMLTDALTGAQLLNNAQRLTYMQLVRSGGVDLRQPAGSVRNPRYMRGDGAQPDPGEYYLDRDGAVKLAPEQQTAEPGAKAAGDDTGFYGLGFEWLTGTGPRSHEFEAGDPATETLPRHNHIEKVRQRIAESRPVVDGSPVSAHYSLRGLGGIPEFISAYAAVPTGGMLGNLGAAYLGSYPMTYTVRDVDKDGVATVDFEVTNTSSLESATRPPLGRIDIQRIQRMEAAMWMKAR